MRLPASLLLGASLAVLPVSTATAEPIAIELLSGTFTTRVSITEFVSGFGSPLRPPVTREMVSAAPLSDALLVPVTPNPGLPALPSEVGAIAETDLFRVHAETSSFAPTPLWASSSLAKTDLVFRPVLTASGTIDITLTPAINTGANHWSEGTIRLVDLTTMDTVWDVGWDSVVAGATPDHGFWRPPTYHTILYNAPLYTAGTLAFDTDFDASHAYALTIYTLTQSQNDSQGIALEVTGLHVVPEPSTVWLFGLGVIGLHLSVMRIPIRRFVTVRLVPDPNHSGVLIALGRAGWLPPTSTVSQSS
jgi:hypothetical protein